MRGQQLAGNNTYNCDLCGRVVVGSRHGAVCPTNKPILQRVAATVLSDCV